MSRVADPGELDELRAFKTRVMAMKLKTDRHGQPAKRNYGRGYNQAVLRVQGKIT